MVSVFEQSFTKILKLQPKSKFNQKIQNLKKDVKNEKVEGMKESKAVNVTKRDIRNNLLHREYQLYSNKITYQFEEPIKYARRSKDVGLQYNWKRDNVICTCKNFIGLKKQQEPQYFSSWPRQVVASRSFNDIGVGSVKGLPKRKVRRIYLPETDERGVGSSDLSSYIVRKSRFVYGNSFYDQNRTSSKCVGGTVETNIESVVSATVSPIDFTKSGTTSPKEPAPVYTLTNKEIGSHIVRKAKDTTTAQIGTDDIAGDEESPKMMNNFKASISEKDYEQKKKAEVATSADKSQGDRKMLRDKSFSSDSLVQHVHNLENPSQDKNYKETPSVDVDPMDNRLDKEYNNMFTIKSIEIQPQTSNAGKRMSDMKTPSVLRRRFEALRRTLGRKNESRDDCKKNVIPVDTSKSKTSQASDPSRRDASITSDPPSLEGRSYSSCTKPFNAYASKPSKVHQRASFKKSYTGNKKEKDQSSSKLMGFAIDSEYEQEGVKGMFKLWGNKFNLDEADPNEEGELNQSFELNEVPEVEEIEEKKGRKFFFFKRKNAKVKDKNKEAFKQKKGITTGRCEVSDGLSIKIGGNNGPPTNTKNKIKTPPAESFEEILRKSWLLKYLSNPIESRNSVQVRWNNRTYTTSSSTVFELMENVYKDTGVIFRSRSDVMTDESSYYRSFTRPRVNFMQKVEAWMIPKTITDIPITLNNKFPQKKEPKTIEVSISDQKWFIDKSEAFAKKIEVVLHSNNFVKLHNTDPKTEYLKIDIPKGFFSDDTSSEDPREHTSDEQVYKIVEYDTFKSSSDVNKVKNQGLDTGDHDHTPKDIKVTISVKDKHHESKIVDTVMNNKQRDVVTQGSNVFIPKKCDVIGVGIITQRDAPLKVVRPKSILKILEYETDDDSESSIHITPKKCEFAESFLQDYYKSCAPLAIDLFSWCVSDSHIQGCSDINSNGSYNNGDGSKSCPNISDDYGHMRDHDQSSCHSTSSELCVTTAAAPKMGQNENFNKNAKKKKKKGDPDNDLRVLPKDSLEVLKKRQLYAKSNKSNWNCDTVSAKSGTTCSATSRDHYKRDSPGDKDCPKTKRDCANKPIRPPPRGEKPCKKHVSLPDCDSMNENTAKILSDAPIPGILTIGRQKGSCDTCNAKKNTTEKHAQIDGKVCEIKEAECKKFCLEQKHPHCEKTGADDCTPGRVPGVPRPRPHSIRRAEDHLYDKDPKCSNTPQRGRSPPRPVQSPPNMSPARSPPMSPRSPNCSPPRSPHNDNKTPPRSPCQSPPRSPTGSAGSGGRPAPTCCRSRNNGHSRSPPRSPRSPTGSAGSGGRPAGQPPDLGAPKCCRSRTSGHHIERQNDRRPDVERCDYGEKEGKRKAEKRKKKREEDDEEADEPRSPCPPMPPCCPPPAPACPTPGAPKKRGFFGFGNKDCPAHPTPKPCPAHPKPKPCLAQPKPKPCPANPEPKPKAEKCPSDPKPKCPETPKPRSHEPKQDCPKIPSCQEPPGSVRSEDSCGHCQPVCPPPACKPSCPPPTNKCPPKQSQSPEAKGKSKPDCPPRFSPPCPQEPPDSVRSEDSCGHCQPVCPPPARKPSCPPPTDKCPPKQSQSPEAKGKSRPDCPPKFSPPCPPKEECLNGPRPPMMTTISHCSLSPCKDLPPPPKPPPPPPPGPKLPCSGCPTPPCYIPTEAELEAQRCIPPNKCVEKCPFSTTPSDIQSTASSESLESTHRCPPMPPCGVPRSPNRPMPMTPPSPNIEYTPRSPNRPMTPQSPNRPVAPRSPNRPMTPQGPNRPVAPQNPNRTMTPRQNKPVRAMPPPAPKTPNPTECTATPPPVPKTPNPTECTSISRGVGADRGRCNQTQTPRSKLSVCDRECSSRSRVSGIYLKQKPAKKRTCASDCSAWDQLGRSQFVQGNVIHINSREKITIKLRGENPSVEEIREPNCVTVKDAHGQTLYEREDHVAGHRSQKWSETECQKERNPLLDDLYRDSKCNRISADPITINEMRSSEKTLDDHDSNESVANLIEINFKLKLAQGDKTTEINIGNEGDIQNTKKSQLGNVPQEVFVMKDGKNFETKDSVHTKDINIRILVKNFKGEKSKPEKKQYLLCHDDFSKQISNKFQTVSTGYDMGLDYRDEVAETERVFSIHRATVDLTTSESKTLLKASGDVLNLKSVANSKLSVELNSGDLTILPPKLSYYSQHTTDTPMLVAQASENGKVTPGKSEMIHKTNANKSKIYIEDLDCKKSKAKSRELEIKVTESKIQAKQSKVEQVSYELDEKISIEPNIEIEQITQGPELTPSYDNARLEAKSRGSTAINESNEENMKHEVAFGESAIVIAKSLTSKISKLIKSEVEKLYVRESNLENTDTEYDPDTSGCNDDRTDLENKTSGEPNYEENKFSTEASNLGNRTSNEPTLPSSRGSRRESGKISRNSTLPHINTYTSEERFEFGDKTSNDLTELPTSNDDAENTYKSSEDLSLNKKLNGLPCKVDFKNEDPESIVNQNLSTASIAKEDYEKEEKTKNKFKGSCCRNKMKNPKKSNREEKKEMLKQVFEHGESCLNKPKTKNRIQKLKEMLKAILTSDSSEPEELNAPSNELAKDITYNSIKPAFFKNSDSLNNYLVSSMPSDNSDVQPKYHTTEECNSICSSKDSDGWSLEDGKRERTGCMCTTFASRLKMKLCNDDIAAGCCCGKKPAKVNQETTCDIHNEDEFFCLNYKSAELIDVETQNTRCNSTNMSFISREDQEVVSNVEDLERDSIENVAEEVAAQVMEPDTLVSIQQVIRSSKTLSKQFTPRTSYTKEKRNTRLGISNDDKIVFLETKSTKICSVAKYRNSNEKYKHGHREHKFKPADILQLYETKKAVLEIYAEKTETEDGEHIVAKLPRFVIDTDMQINSMKEHLKRNGQCQNYCKRNIVMMSFGR